MKVGGVELNGLPAWLQEKLMKADADFGRDDSARFSAFAEVADHLREPLVPTQQDELDRAYELGWFEVKGVYARLAPILHHLIVREVRRIDPAIKVVPLEPTDQGGPGWVFGGSSLPLEHDDLIDSDELSALFRDLGEFYSSEDHPALDYPITDEVPEFLNLAVSS